MIGLRRRGYTNTRIAIDLSRFIRVDEHENAVRLHNLLCHIRLRPKPAKPSIKKNLPWQYVAGLQLPNLGPSERTSLIWTLLHHLLLHSVNQCIPRHLKASQQQRVNKIRHSLCAKKIDNLQSKNGD